jgi:cytochrome b6-f complex subunit 5
MSNFSRISPIERDPSHLKWSMKKSHLNFKEILHMVEPLLSGIVLGLITVTLAGLFFAAYDQYKRGNQLGE